MPLLPEQIPIVDYYEQWYFSQDKIDSKTPDIRAMSDRLGLKATTIHMHLRADSVIKALEKRGIKLPGTIDGLSTEQLACANVLLDFSDRRPQNKKLKELGVSNQRYQGWLRNPEFSRYLRGRAEALLGNSQHEAHAALLANVQRGDFQSIKLFYEMTGRWSSRTTGELNVQFIMMKIIESIQRHVKDPVAIHAIANDISTLLPDNSIQGVGEGQVIPVPETINNRAELVQATPNPPVSEVP